jgi:hypothetical protein
LGERLGRIDRANACGEGEMHLWDELKEFLGVLKSMDDASVVGATSNSSGAKTLGS